MALNLETGNIDKLLNVRLADFFARDPYMDRTFHRLEKQEILLLKDIVQSPKDELTKKFSRARIQKTHQKKIEELVKTFGLKPNLN